jgi:hypothetical protein
MVKNACDEKDRERAPCLPLPHPTTTVGTNDTQEVAMDDTTFVLTAQRAVLAMAEIKAATEAFDRGDTNVFEALDAVTVAVTGYAEREAGKREAA